MFPRGPGAAARARTADSRRCATPTTSGSGPRAARPNRETVSTPRPDACRLLPQVVFEQFEDALVFVGPARLLGEAVVLHRIRRDRPVFLAQLDQPLHKPDGI